MMQVLKTLFREHKDSRKTFFQMFVVACVALMHFLTFFPMSPDDEIAVTREDPSVWIKDDRWFAFIIEVIFDQPVIPFFYYFVFIILLGISFATFVLALNYPMGWVSVIAFSLVAAFPSLWMLLSFSANVLPLGFGLLFSALGFYIFAREFDSIFSNTRPEIRTKSWLALLASSVLVGFATASYHSASLLFMIGVFSWVVLGNRPNSKNFILTFAGSVVFLFGLAFWATVGFLAKLAFGVPLAPEYSYIQGYWRPDAFWSNPLNSFISLLNEVVMHYSVNEVLYGRSAGLVFVIVVSGLIMLFVSRSPGLVSKLVAYLGLLITPFAFSFESI
jgi:hypothetical protein